MLEEMIYCRYEGENRQRHPEESRVNTTSKLNWSYEERGKQRAKRP